MAWVTPRVWNNETITDAKLNEISSSLNAVGDKPVAYTPTAAGFTSNFTIAGTEQNMGQWTQFTITVTFTGAPAGSGVASVLLPSTPSADYTSFASAFGTCIARDVSVATNAGGVSAGVATYAGGRNLTAYFATNQRLANSYPYTYASGDVLHFQGRYYRD